MRALAVVVLPVLVAGFVIYAAVVGGIYDLQGLMESTKQRMPGVANRVMKLIPDYSSRGAAALAERSAMQWPEKLAVRC